MVVPVRKHMGEVVQALHEITDSYGSPVDQPIIKRFLKAPLTADYMDFIYVGRIPLSNFYAHSDDAFDAKSLWHQIQTEVGESKLPKPPKLDSASLVSELAIWVDANVEE
jgi:hypothetical protein